MMCTLPDILRTLFPSLPRRPPLSPLLPVIIHHQVEIMRPFFVGTCERPESLFTNFVLGIIHQSTWDGRSVEEEEEEEELEEGEDE